MELFVKILSALKSIKAGLSTGDAKFTVVQSRQPARAFNMIIMGAAMVKQDFTISCNRAVFTAKGTSIRFAFGLSSGVTVTAASHLLLIGATQEFTFPSGSWVAAIADGSSNGSLEVSEIL
jgi:hypothetical protein